MSGWVKLHRKITEHWIYQEKPFDKRSAWNDLIMFANHKENKAIIGNRVIKVERGSFITSEVKMAERWGWTRKSVRIFLKLLENDGMLTKKSTTKYTAVTIANYGLYQGEGTTEDTTKEQQRNNKGTTKEQRSIHKQEDKESKNEKKLKNEKKEKDIKNIYADAVKLKPDEHQKLVELFGQPGADERIQNLSLYIQSKGDKYKSHYATILNWERKNGPEKVAKKEKSSNPFNEIALERGYWT